MELIYSLNDTQAADIAISGGKGASLAKTIQALPVPDGLILSCEAYKQFISPLFGQISSLLAQHPDNEQNASESIRQLILSAPLPDSLTTLLSTRLHDSQLTHVPLAVRSSGTLEDMPGAAFAGQHDTILGVRDLPSLHDAIRQCYASLWHTHVMLYRQHLQLPHQHAAMAVVLQRMVDVRENEAAGVAFSIDPVRGNLSSVLINAAFGLGETVVGGEEPIDEYQVDRDSLQIVHQEIAEKQRAIVMTDKGTDILPLVSPAKNQTTLTSEQCQAVAELAIRAEQYFQFPQDIEWAFHDQQLWLLQSRNVTQIAPIWTRDESAERFPNPITPLTWDMCEAGFHASLNYSLNLMGLPSFNGKWFTMKDYYIYGNQNAVALYHNRLPTSMMNDLPTLLSSLPEIARKFAWVQELPITWMRDLDRYLIGIGALNQEPLQEKKLSELWDYIQRINKLGSDYFLPNIAISLTQRSLYAALIALLKMLYQGDEQLAHKTLDSLIAMSETKTGQVNNELWSLSRLVRHDAKLFALLKAIDAGSIMDTLKQAHPDFFTEFTAFLTNHGHREMDFDAYHPTWLDAPHIVLTQISAMADLENDGQTSDTLSKKIAQSKTEFEIISQTPEELRYFMQELIRLARVYTALDDLEHYQTTRLALPMRRGLHALGERLVIRGVIDQASDIYFAKEQQLADAINAETTQAFSELRQHISSNKAGYEQARSTTPQWVYGEISEETEDDGSSLKGLAGSAGTVEGEVFLVHGPEDFAQFPQGAILVARTTNPAWTALFYRASGVITESGGPLSHGAVTARELGLPAVMGIRRVMNMLKNGQRVKVDGQKGIVELL
ncbi:TPA: phosphoenolpyruvate synthase [Providencia stuartii]|uniref:PEP/pyruvate-binding domain-containing protein n=1 Tax=Providencia stuartii TaxID=588 RepID=UPI001239B591|nr:PEP/pyruvate-binding domain-containing protein [Providencia stuartii]QET99151.1 phosphoenolpyruvate synthase [Providencia stuartii]HEM8142531.1 phosphoenolpyruvate synthase [Providencia stuartii]HEM8872514.1 phosphoenolpyruvate synthase [Providencia stuartii]